MSACQRRDYEDQSVDDKDPGEEEMPASSHRQPLMLWKGHPLRESSAVGFSGVIGGDAEEPGGIERVAEESGYPPEFATFRLDRLHCQERPIAVRALSPVEGRMGVEDLKSAHQKNGKTNDIQPMSQPDKKRMSKAPSIGEGRIRFERLRFGLVTVG